ncbi:MAG: AraC family transcriptional regulator [Eubacteriales bacterium]|nr:AraC family transcriptional regulator [Eubacteriales bacterium]
MSDIFFSIFPNENFVDLGLFQYGREQCEAAHSYGPAKRNHFLFHYVISGAGTLLADDSKGETRTYHIKSNQGFMIFPDQINTYIADERNPWEYIWIEFDGLRVKSLLEMTRLTEDDPVYRPRFKDVREEMFGEMAYIVDHADSSPFHLIGHLYLFLDALVRSIAELKVTTGSKLRDFYIQEAIAYIEHNYQNAISVETVAEKCGLNRSYFGKIFKDAIGKTPQEFILSYRMAKAAELLKLTAMSVADIGNAVGYENQLHFSRAFKNIYGLPPREWRNQHKIR